MTTRVQTGAGEGEGRVEGDLQVFRGIPYAEAPTGALRFKPPVRISSFPGRVNATGFAPSPQQSPAMLVVARFVQGAGGAMTQGVR